MRWNGSSSFLIFHNQRVVQRFVRSVHDHRDQAAVGVLKRRALDGASAGRRTHSQSAGLNEPGEMPDVVVRRREDQ